MHHPSDDVSPSMKLWGWALIAIALMVGSSMGLLIVTTDDLVRKIMAGSMGVVPIIACLSVSWLILCREPKRQQTALAHRYLFESKIAHAKDIVEDSTLSKSEKMERLDRL